MPSASIIIYCNQLCIPTQSRGPPLSLLTVCSFKFHNLFICLGTNMPRVCYRLSNMPKDRCQLIVCIPWFKKFLKLFITLKVLAYWDWPTSRMKKSSWVFKCWKMLKYIYFWTVHQRLNSVVNFTQNERVEFIWARLTLQLRLFTQTCLAKKVPSSFVCVFCMSPSLYYFLVVFISRLGYRFCLL